MDGVTETGVTIMRMDPGLDTGPTARVVTTPVGAADDAGVVMDRLCALAGPALEDTLDDVQAGAFVTIPQPAEGATYAAKIGPEDRALSLTDTAAVFADRIRALAPHIGATCRIGGEPFKVWAARRTDGEAPPGLSVRDGELVVGLADGVVEILELQPPGKARMRAADFLRGWRGGLEMGE